MANNLPTQGNRAATVAATNPEARTVELAFSSDAETKMKNYYEVLSHAPGACDLTRLNDGGALLWNHIIDDQIGVVERAWIDTDGKGRALVRLSESQRGSEILADILGGIKRHVSVAYNIQGVHLSGERDGLDVVTVTSWQPYEISIVSVPADTTVGVGRAMRNATNSTAGNVAGTQLTASITELLRRADEAQPLRIRDTSGLPTELRHLASDEHVRFLPQPAAASLLLEASQLDVGHIFAAGGKLRHLPGAIASGKTVRLPVALAQLSRVGIAGTGVIQWDGGDKAIRIPGGAGRDGVAWMRRPKAIRVCRPAVFKVLDHSVDADGRVNDQDESETQPHPALVVPFDFPKESQTLAASFVLKRRDRRDIDPEILAVEIVSAIAMGLAEQADRLVLAKIASIRPAAFKLAGVATSGLQLDDLQAITNGEAAAIGADGVLRAAGVPAHLSSQAPGTIVGNFSRSALVVGERFDMHARKLGRSGDLEVTVLVDALAVVADPMAFWSVTA